MATVTNSVPSFLEITPQSGDDSASSQFTHKSSQVTRRFMVSGTGPANTSSTDNPQLNYVTLSDLQYLPTVALGSNSTAGGGSLSLKPGRGTIYRQLPLADPVWPWLFAEDIRIRGKGFAGKDTAAVKLEAPQIAGKYPLYPAYEASITFTPRPFAVLSDTNCPAYGGSQGVGGLGGGIAGSGGTGAGATGTGSGIPASATNLGLTFYDDNGNLQLNQLYALEWLRWTNYDTASQANFITARQGNYAFRTTSAQGASTNPNGNIFPGMPRIRLPDYLIKFRWFDVPYRYVISANSYINYFIGRVNQLDFDGANFPTTPTYPWKAGELLYLGYVAYPFTPPVPTTSPLSSGSTFVSADRLCDIEFAFLGTKRAAALPAPTPAQKNWIYAGHNLLPWLKTRLFYAATVKPDSTDSSSQWAPVWLSFPFQLLFTDPDTAGGYKCLV